jgi:cytochrome c-type biogenesis protein CcmE
MQFILDHIAAIVIYVTIALSIITLQLRTMASTTEATIAYMSKKQTLEFADLLEQEIKLIGTGTAQKITNVSTNADGQTTNFTFWWNDGASDLEVEYRLIATDTVTVDGEVIPRYRMDRYVNGALNGGGPSTLRDFRVEPLDASGNVTGAASAIMVRAQVVNTYPLGDLEDMYIGRTFWGMTLLPMNL